MNAPARKLNLEELLRKWWVATRTVQGIEQTISEHQGRLDDASCTLDLIENDIGRACECSDRSMVYCIEGNVVVLAWQEEKEYHTIELSNVETI